MNPPGFFHITKFGNNLLNRQSTLIQLKTGETVTRRTMKKKLIVIVVFIITTVTHAQQTNLRFDFGTTRTGKGYIAITPESKYTTASGYGFTNASQLTAVDHGGFIKCIPFSLP